MAKRISIINFKGGVGKTTLAFEIAAGLVRYHKPCRVLLIDIDHQSSLSIVCLGATDWEKAVEEKRTTTEIIKPFIAHAKMPGSEIIIENALKKPAYKNLDLVPASLELDDVEIELTSSHQGNAILSEWNKRTLLCRWIEEAEIDEDYDYILFDCPPATKVVSQNAIAASHGYIVPVVPEAVMERGAPHLSNMIENGIDIRLKALEAAATDAKRPVYVKNTMLVGLVITKITTHRGFSGYTNDHTRHLSSLQRTWQKKLVQPYIEQGVGVSETLAAGVPVYDRAYNQNVGGRGFPQMYKDLTSELKQRIDAL